MIDSAAGDTSAAARPCSARKAMSWPGEVADGIQQRGDREEGDAGDEEALAAEEISRTATEQQETAEHQRVSVDDPGQIGRL